MSKANKNKGEKVIKNYFENAEIVKGILQRECNAHGDIRGTALFMSLNLEDKEDREFLEEQILQIKDILDKAIKELGCEE